MRRASGAFVVVFAAGLVLVLGAGALEQRSEAFTLGVVPVAPLSLPPGAEACQRSIAPPADFSRVRLEVGSGRRRPPALDVRVLSANRVLAKGPSAGALGGRRALVVTVGEVSTRDLISVCVRNGGGRAVTLYGNAAMANPASFASLDGEPVNQDLALSFLRPSGVSLISLAGDMVSRASLFRGEWIGAGSVWLAVIMVITAFPLLLYRALRGLDR